MRALLLPILLLTGCATATLPVPNQVLTIETNRGDVLYRGSGSVIAHVAEGDYVLTAGHVVGAKEGEEPWEALYEVDGHPAELVAYGIGSTAHGYLDLGLLFVPNVRFTLPALELGRIINDMPFEAHTIHGVKTITIQDGSLVAHPYIEPGDSGSAMIREGKMVGVVFGMYTDLRDGTQTVGYVDTITVRWFLSLGK